MAGQTTVSPPSPARLVKCPTGIAGLDLITSGGLPRGRPALLCGGPVGQDPDLHGIPRARLARFDENGVFLHFEETQKELAKMSPRSATTLQS